MPQYLMSVRHDDDYDVDFSSPDAQRMVAQVSAVNAELEAAGARGVRGVLLGVVGHGRPQQRRRRSMIDGPYAETKEQMGGFWVIEAADLDAALAWACKAAVM